MNREKLQAQEAASIGQQSASALDLERKMLDNLDNEQRGNTGMAVSPVDQEGAGTLSEEEAGPPDAVGPA